MVAVVPIGICGFEKYNSDNNNLISLLYGFHLVRCDDVATSEQDWIFDGLTYVSDDGFLYHLLFYVTTSFAVVGVLDETARDFHESVVSKKQEEGENEERVVYTVPFVFIRNEYVMRSACKTAAYLGTIGNARYGKIYSVREIQPVLSPVFASEYDNVQEITSLLKFVPMFPLCNKKVRESLIPRS